MSKRSKLIHRSAVVVVIAAAASIGTAIGVHAVGDDGSAVPPAPRAAEVEPRCDLLPDSWVVHDVVISDAEGTEVNAWAAGDAAVAHYFNELSRLCAGSQ